MLLSLKIKIKIFSTQTKLISSICLVTLYLNNRNLLHWVCMKAIFYLVFWIIPYFSSSSRICVWTETDNDLGGNAEDVFPNYRPTSILKKSSDMQVGFSSVFSSCNLWFSAGWGLFHFETIIHFWFWNIQSARDLGQF